MFVLLSCMCVFALLLLSCLFHTLVNINKFKKILIIFLFNVCRKRKTLMTLFHRTKKRTNFIQNQRINFIQNKQSNTIHDRQTFLLNVRSIYIASLFEDFQCICVLSCVLF